MANFKIINGPTFIGVGKVLGDYGDLLLVYFERGGGRNPNDLKFLRIIVNPGRDLPLDQNNKLVERIM